MVPIHSIPHVMEYIAPSMLVHDVDCTPAGHRSELLLGHGEGVAPLDDRTLVLVVELATGTTE
jgi:hypothetical protein